MSRFQTLKKLFDRLLSDEQGAEGLEKILIIGAIVIPLLGFLIAFRNQLSSWMSGEWTNLADDADSGLADPTLP